MKPIFFENQNEFRKWLQKNHDKETELLVGFYKVNTGKNSITWPQSVDQALCFGWIDGVRKSIDEESYQIRFTPRKKDSIWSAINIEKIEVLTGKGMMHHSGIESFNHRKESKSKIYSYEQEGVSFSILEEKQFKANKKAWKYFQLLAPSYQKSSINWVVSAKQDSTKTKRLNELIQDSEVGINKWKNNKYSK